MEGAVRGAKVSRNQCQKDQTQDKKQGKKNCTNDAKKLRTTIGKVPEKKGQRNVVKKRGGKDACWGRIPETGGTEAQLCSCKSSNGAAQEQ